MGESGSLLGHVRVGDNQIMKGRGTIGWGIALIGAGLLCTATVGSAQGGASSGGAAGGAAAASSMSRNIGRDTSPLNPENSLELIKPVDRSEESAFREFQHASTENMPRKIELGEQFLKKYRKSAYM